MIIDIPSINPIAETNFNQYLKVVEKVMLNALSYPSKMLKWTASQIVSNQTWEALELKPTKQNFLLKAQNQLIHIFLSTRSILQNWTYSFHWWQTQKCHSKPHFYLLVRSLVGGPNCCPLASDPPMWSLTVFPLHQRDLDRVQSGFYNSFQDHHNHQL